MDHYGDYAYHAYSWHQSHDQATVLLIVPYETVEEDVVVVLESNYLVAGVQGQPAVVKGMLYGPVDPSNSVWQLEPQSSRLSARERTASTASTASTQSSFAYVSDPEISSSFAASVEGGMASDWESPTLGTSPLSSPVLSSGDEHQSGYIQQQSTLPSASRSTSPHRIRRLGFASSFSSIESLHRQRSGRLLTLHLEKAESVIWPSLISGPVLETLSPCSPGPPGSDPEVEPQYNMDPTSLTLIGLDLYDIRKDKEAAFECFLRAWRQARVPSAALRLATHYLPPQTIAPKTPSPRPRASTLVPDTPTQEDPQTPIPSFSLSPRPLKGTPEYFSAAIGGPQFLAQLYLEIGLLYLDGSASILLSSSSALSLSSIRLPQQSTSSTITGRRTSPDGTHAWKRDREAARRFFERAQLLSPDLDVPTLASDSDTSPSPVASGVDLQMPTLDVSAPSADAVEPSRARRRRKREADVKAEALVKMGLGRPTESAFGEELDDHGWYLYVPGLIGAGTALMAVAVVGALSLSSWRKNQGS